MGKSTWNKIAGKQFTSVAERMGIKPKKIKPLGKKLADRYDNSGKNVVKMTKTLINDIKQSSAGQLPSRLKKFLN
jgi:hypothetical protein